jgi:hypothetical protein
MRRLAENRKTTGWFCVHAKKLCKALRQSVQRRQHSRRRSRPINVIKTMEVTAGNTVVRDKKNTASWSSTDQYTRAGKVFTKHRRYALKKKKFCLSGVGWIENHRLDKFWCCYRKGKCLLGITCGSHNWIRWGSWRRHMSIVRETVLLLDT